MMKKAFMLGVVGLFAAIVAVTPAFMNNARAASKAMQICEARWAAHVKTLPAEPSASAKAAYIKDCMKHPPTIPSTTATHNLAAPITTNSPDPDKPVTTNPPDPEKLPTSGH